MYCGMLEWILEQKKDINEITGEIRTNSAINSTVNKTNFLVLITVLQLQRTLTKAEAE